MGHRYGSDKPAAQAATGGDAALQQCIDARTPDALDYSVVDAAVVPTEAAAATHSEALWVMSGCYMPEDPGQPMGAFEDGREG